MQQLLGLCQQFSLWVLDIAPATLKMRLLLRKTSAFVWTPECEAEFMVNIVRCGNVTAKRSWASMAPIEAAATGIDWVVDHCSHYLKGSDKVVTVVTDHFPLVASC